MSVRNGCLVLAEPKFPDAPKGTCTWCGDPIELVADAGPQRKGRRYHYGDSWETGEQKCHAEYLRSRTWDPRTLILWRGDAECVDCGSDGPDWDADHDVPLWKGGAHHPDNIVRRCSAPCHRDKTAREATERAAMRRTERGQPMNLLQQENNERNTITMYRQGDIMLVPVEKIPDRANKAVPQEKGRIVLAHGEVTGHAHVLEGEATFVAEDLSDLENRFLRVEAEAQLVHDEHSALTIPPGEYEVRRQKEYAPEASRLVAD